MAFKHIGIDNFACVLKNKSVVIILFWHFFPDHRIKYKPTTSTTTTMRTPPIRTTHLTIWEDPKEPSIDGNKHGGISCTGYFVVICTSI